MIFALLVPGAVATEAELLAFTAARVDEAPTRPKAVTVIAAMSMTNVGKIYKPELRMLAAQQVASAMVEHLCTELGIDSANGPVVEVVDGNALQVCVNAATVGPMAAELHAQLAQALGRLPIRAVVMPWSCSTPQVGLPPALTFAAVRSSPPPTAP